MKIKDIAEKIDQIVPLKLAQEWDNVGLLIGDANREVKKILLTIDITKEVLAEAKGTKTGLILSYHPVIWDGLKKITADCPDKIIYDLLSSNIAVFSVHTALDVSVGGVNDGLAEMVGIAEPKPIGDFVADPSGDNFKLVVFIPLKSATKVSKSVFAAGAGAIGNYSNCGFQAKGEGTFLPLDGSNPAIGKKGKLEKVPEVRFETIVPSDKVDKVIAAMKNAHPYETPAFDFFKLYNGSDKFGLGRIGKLQKPMTVKKIIERIKKQTRAKTFGIVGNDKKIVKTAAVCAGSCGRIINQVIAAKADLYVTGELKHHQALAAQEANVTCICLSHSVSERFILKKFAKQLQKQVKQVTIKISKKDTEPFKWKNL